MVVPHRANVWQRLAARSVFIAERFFTLTLRWRWHDESGLFRRQPVQPVIYGVWHNRLALSMGILRLYPRRLQPQRRLAALVSASRDGALLARILENFGVQPVRGSSSRRGAQALLELTGWAERGYDLAITPDGPRGPRYVVQEGIVAIAQLTGLPIVPVTCQIRWKTRLKSWDQFQVPVPFSRCDVNFGQPIIIERDAAPEEREALRIALQAALGRD